MIVIINNKLITIDMGKIEKNKRILFFLFSATSFDKAVGNPN